MGKGFVSNARKGARSAKIGQTKSHPIIRGIIQLWNEINISKKDDVIVGDKNQVPQKQFARKYHEAIKVALNRRLVSYISRQSRIPTAIMGADTDHCYDRIANLFSILTCLWAGIPLCTVQLILRPLKNINVFIRTGYGDSYIFYGGDEDKLFQGSRQGNG